MEQTLEYSGKLVEHFGNKQLTAIVDVNIFNLEKWIYAHYSSHTVQWLIPYTTE